MIVTTVKEYKNVRLRMYNGEYSGIRYWLDSLVITLVAGLPVKHSRFLWSENLEELEAEYNRDVRKQKRAESRGL